MQHLKSFQLFESAIITTSNGIGLGITVSGDNFYIEEGTVVNDVPLRYEKVFLYQLQYYIAEMIEKKFEFRFSKKEMRDRYLYCEFADSDMFKLSIHATFSGTDFDLVLCVKQSDGKYLRNQSIKVDAVGKLLDKITPWRQSQKLLDLDKKSGVFE